MSTGTRLALRFAAATLGVGIVGGAVTAGLYVLHDLADSPAGRFLAVGLPVLLIALTGWRLAGVGGLVGSVPDGRWLGGIAAAGVVLTAVVLGGSDAGGFADDVVHNLGVTALVLFLGALFGAAPALAVILVGVPALLVLGRGRIARPAAQVALTLFAMAVTGGFALWIAPELRAEVVVGVAVALAGTGAALTARWTLAGREA